MAVRVDSINGDSTFLLTFTSTESALTDYQSDLSKLTVLVDPWLVGASTIFHRKLAHSQRIEDAAIKHLSEIRPPPDIILVSQDKPDHCHEPTLKQLPPNLLGTVIIAQADAAKRIRGWKYFDENKIWSFSNYSPKRPSTIFDLSLPLDPDARTVVHTGRLTLAFMAPKFDIAGVHNAIGFTYRAPIFTNSDETRASLGVPVRPLLIQPQNDLPLRGYRSAYALLPTPPDSPDEVPPTMLGSPPCSPKPVYSSPVAPPNDGVPTPPLTSFPPPPPIPDEEETKGLRSRTTSSGSLRALHNRASRFITKSTPNLRLSEVPKGRKRHSRTSSTATQDAVPRHGRGALSIATTLSVPSKGGRTDSSITALPPYPSQDHLLTSPYSPITQNLPSTPTTPFTISSPLPSPLPPRSSPGTTISVLYSPHGVSYTHIAPWASSHLVSLSALPLTVLLHPMTHIQNLWFLGGNIATGWKGGLEIAQKLMAKTWVAAHEGEKTDSGLLVRTVKKKGDRTGSAELEGKGSWKGTQIVEMGIGATKIFA